jgi:cellulose synthase/poly-beta-1,6-N-acetylglucosamine synthase-like glycosyltransferase
MTVALTVVFWLGLLLVAHTYVLFPWLLGWLARGRQQQAQVYAPGAAELPAVDILLAAHNEEAVIAEKVRSTFVTTYPLDRLRLLVGSDNSSDQTNALLTQLSREYPQLHVEIYTERTGKP